MEAHIIGYYHSGSSWFGGDQADQSNHLGVFKALKKEDLGLDEAGPDHLQMFYKLLEKVPV